MRKLYKQVQTHGNHQIGISAENKKTTQVEKMSVVDVSYKKKM
jgi:hypothetical protein